MRYSTLLAVGAAALSLTACDQVQNQMQKIPFLGKKAAPPEPVAEAPAPVETPPPAATEPPPAPVAAQPEPAPARPARVTPEPARSLVEEPWTLIDAGPVAPGMTREEVIAAWGPPVAESASGNRTFLFYRNGVEVTRGTFDVVFLEDGQVIDAIVRAQGRRYTGLSSSPADRVAEYTPPERIPDADRRSP